MNENSKASNSRTKIYGSKLKSARVSLQKSIEEVAAELNLNKSIIESIEEMDETKLPSAVFVKGYIRTYAKFVQIEPENLIKDFSDIDETEVVIEIAKNKTKNEFNFEPNFKISLAVIIIIVLVLMFFSFNTTEKNTDKSFGANMDVTAIGDSLKNEHAIEQNDEYKVKEPETEALAISEESLPLENTDDVENSEQQLEKMVPDVVEIAIDGEIINTETDYKNGLLIIANENSWMEISNNENKRIFSGVLAKGEQQYFTDSEFYKLIIGRSNAVIIEYFGQVVDFSVYTQSNGISRFDISKDGLSESSVPRQSKKETLVIDLET